MAETVNKTYELKFALCYVNCTNYKEKELINFRNLISHARLGQQIKFANYATISFNENDKKHETPIVSELQNYGRGKTNGIIFDIIDDRITKYNKILVYKTQYKSDAYYGYIMYTIETGVSHHIYSPCDVMPDELCIHIYKTLDLNIRNN